MTDVAIRNTGSTLSIQDGQTNFNEYQLAALAKAGVRNAPPEEVAVFFHQAKSSGLDPFKREIYMIERGGKWNIQTGIDGFYKVADRVSRATGGTWGITETLWCGPDGQWTDVWLQSTPPAAAKVTIERNGSRFTVVALTSEYQAQGPMWKKMPARMIAKCAESLGIRKAFPNDFAGLYTAEEMGQADNPSPGQAGRQYGIRANMPQHAAPTPDEAARRDAYARLTAAFEAAGIPKEQRSREAIDWAESEWDKKIKSPNDLTVDEVHQLAAYFEAVTTPAPTQDEADPVTGEVLDWEAQGVPS